MSTTVSARRQRKRKQASLPAPSKQAVWDEAIAAIAGGFAHDANNCLTGIFSMSDLCLAQVDQQNPLHESLSLMRDSASQASQLLQRLTRLIYDVPGTRTYYDLNEVTSETVDIVRRIVPRNLDLRLDLNAEPLPIFADVVELRQVLICLALNAVDGVREAAAVTVCTRANSEPLNLPDLSDHQLAPPFVTVQIADFPLSLPPGWHSGSGDEAPNKAGSGEKSVQRLLLARAFAEKHGGALALEAKTGKGGIVHLCLPRADLS
jgi:signal transduction histidine kinase